MSISHAVWHHTVRIQSRLIDECGRGGRDLSAKEKDQPLFALASLRLSRSPRPLCIRNRSRARLTAGVPGTEHLTRHMVTYGAYTGRLIDECGVDAAGALRYALEDQPSAFASRSRLDLALAAGRGGDRYAIDLGRV